MKQLVRGQRIKLIDLTPTRDTRWNIEATIEVADKSIDWCCFGLDSAGQLSDERYFVFYNQPTAPQAAVRWSPSSQSSAAFSIDLAALPPTIKRLVFTASIDGSGTMNQIRSGALHIKADAQHVGTYTFSGADFQEEAALIVGELYWKDEWRFAAVGQGFAGGLASLIKHFGGEVLDEPTPAPPVSPLPARTQPSAPTSPPAVVSMPITPQAMPQSVAAGGSLQKLIDAAAAGETVALMRDEYQGPVTISKPLTLDGRGSVLWASQGPVVTVNSLHVVLRDMEIEVTVPEEASGEGDIALKTAPSAPPRLENVRVRGRVAGMSEDGDWSLPPALHLGTLAPRTLNDYRLYVQVPVPCTLKTPIAGLQLHPAQLSPGSHEVTLLVDGVAPETLLLGNIEVHSPVVTRSIPLTGNTLRAEGVSPARQVVLWRE